MERIAAERLVALARTAGGVELRLRRRVSERRLQLMHAALGIQKLFLAGYDLIEDRRLPHLDGFLTQIADACTVRKHDLAFIRLFGTDDDVEHRGLACAVGSDQGKAIMRLHAERRIGKQRASPEAFGDAFDLQDHSGMHHHGVAHLEDTEKVFRLVRR